MGNTSSFEQSIKNQETYVNKRLQDPDMQYLKHGFFSNGHDKQYSDRQIKGFLRQEFNNTRKPNSYVSDRDLEQSKNRRY